MKLTFLGAAREVTGSRFLLEACGKRLMVDYGMEQGADVYANAPLPVCEAEIDYVLLTHAHIDHSGYLPLLYKNGFRGQIITTRATADLCRIMLLDSAHIQEMDAEWKNRKALRSGAEQVEPLYTQQNAIDVCSLIMPCAYGQIVNVCEGLSLRMVDVGHLFGSASIEVTATENGETKVIVFSGDIGNLRQPLLRDPEYLTRADFVIMESTYGDRTHGPTPDYIAELTDILQTTFDRGGNVVIPSFAVGRTQEMLYFIRQIKQEKRLKGHEGFKVYIDSPLGIEATNVLNENMLDCVDEETLALIRQGVNPIAFEGLTVAQSADESKLINDDLSPKVIISASGMCDAGRIRHHLKHNLWRPESTVLFVGYQSVGTLGRSLVDGADEVKLFGETIQVRAEIRRLNGVSGHADSNGLLKWAACFSPKPAHVFVVHGDENASEAFVSRLREELGLNAAAPYNGESWELNPLRMLTEGNHKRLKAPERDRAAADVPQERLVPRAAQGRKKEKAGMPSESYSRLLLTGQKLMSLIERMHKRGKREQNRLANAIDNLLKAYSKR